MINKDKRTIELQDNDSAIVLRGHTDSAFSCELFLPGIKSSGQQTAALIAWMINRKDLGLKQLLKKTSKKWIKAQERNRNARSN
jgi:hypothetical protein